MKNVWNTKPGEGYDGEVVGFNAPQNRRPKARITTPDKGTEVVEFEPKSQHSIGDKVKLVYDPSPRWGELKNNPVRFIES